MPDDRSARMIDVGDKPVTVRTAVAEALLTTRPDVIELVRGGLVEKGNPLRVAEVAGLMGLKRTPELLPLCHPIATSGAEVRASIASETTLHVLVTARTHDRTGVEMEVLTGASVAALCLYDMLKMYDPAMVIGPVRLLEKTGGKHGDWRAPTLPPGSGPAPSP
jgi:cyclic pyranopterin phosphate synthase